MQAGTRRLLAGGGGGGEAGLLTLLNDMPHHQEVAIVWIIVGVLIAINFLWELLTDSIEHAFWRKNRHVIVMLEKLYKGSSVLLIPSHGLLSCVTELTIVGIWSVFLFVLTSGFGVDSPTLKHVFELIHISLFGLVLIYISMVVLMTLISLLMFKRFHSLEELEEGKLTADMFSPPRTTDRAVLRICPPALS